MKEISLTLEQFLIFNEYDQFGFFYDDSGFPTDDADEEFEDNVKELYSRFDSILVTDKDAVYGVKNGQRELLLDWADESFIIASEVIEDF